jgi:hypothetical protein
MGHVAAWLDMFRAVAALHDLVTLAFHLFAQRMGALPAAILLARFSAVNN